MSQTLHEALRERRTIHAFRPEPPPRERILAAIDAARWAPNHRRTEPWRFYLLGPVTATAIAELNAVLVVAAKGAAAGAAKLARWREVPGWLAVTCVAADDPLQAQEDYAAVCCAIQNLQLALWSDGIGVKWTTGAVTRDPRFFAAAGIDAARERLVGLLWYGYPADVPRMDRRPVADVLRERP